MHHHTAARETGFTLMELMIVIALIGILVVAFFPSLAGALGRGDEAETKARMLGVKAMIDAYEKVYGGYPPDDFSTFGGQEFQLGTDNGKNSGIESLVMHLSQDARGGGRLDDHLDWLANTDGDKAAQTIPLLGTTEKYEVVDAWGMPFAYFSGTSGSRYEGRQRIVAPPVGSTEGREQVALPWKTADGVHLGRRSYQLISAGPDSEFNTPDDIVIPERPVEQ